MRFQKQDGPPFEGAAVQVEFFQPIEAASGDDAPHGRVPHPVVAGEN